MTRQQATGGALAIALAIMLLLAAGLRPTTRPALGTSAVTGPPDAGSWTCVTGGASGLDDLRLLAAVPAGADGSSRVDLRQYADGEVVADVLDEVLPGNVVERQGDAETSGLSVQRWSGAPVAAGRVWRSRSGERPVGIVAGPCVSASSDRWVLPALSTGGGDVAEVRLANPYATDAAAAVRLLGPDGASEPVRLANIAVPAGEVVVVRLNEVAPERAELAAEVVVRSGRVVVEGLQATNAAIGGVDGISLVPATPAPAGTWSFPWFEDRPGVQSVVSIANTADQTSVVGVSLQTAEGGRAAGTELVEVPPGTVRRVSLEGLTDDVGPLAGLTLDVEEGPPVSASVVVRYTDGAVPPGEQAAAVGPLEEVPVGAAPPGEDQPDEPATDDTALDDTALDDTALDDTAAGPRTGLAVLDGTEAPDDEWVLFGATSAGRDVALVLANPTGGPATVDVTVATAGGVQEPAALAGLELEPGGHLVVPLDGAALGATATVFVRAAEGEVVAALRGVQLAGPLQVTGPLGVPASPPATVVGDQRLLRDDTLLQPDGRGR